jgi:hypothetical protein
MRKITMSVVVFCASLGVTSPASGELVGWWKLDEGSGTAISDSSDNRLNGTFTGGTPEWIAGKYGNAILFNGANGYVDLGMKSEMDLTEEMTVSVWLRDDGFTVGWQAIFTRGLGWRLQRNATERTLEWTCPPSPFLFGNGTLDDGEWHHVAGTYDSRRQALYIDGALDVEQSVSVAMDPTSYRVMIGSIDTLTDRVWHGPIDDVRLYSHAMTRAEIQAVMRNEPYTLASRGTPKDGSMIDKISATLTWWPGETALSHTVYFGESFEDVNNATTDSWSTTEASLGVGQAGGPYPNGLTPGQTYYWRVDEVDGTNPDSPWKGEVWSFSVRPRTAWGSSPADEERYVPLDQALTWQRGMGSLFHTVYFGATFNEVNDPTTEGTPVSDADRRYDPAIVLEADTTYYWRVDEFSLSGTVRGEVWSFTTMPEIAVTDDPNLMLSWTLHQDSGAVAVDWSGRGHHGELHGDTAWTDAALSFNGGEYVGAPLNVSETEYACALWFKTTDPQCGLFTVVVGDLAAGGGYDRMLYLVGGEFAAHIYCDPAVNGKQPETIMTTGFNLADGGWHHVVHTYGTSLGVQKLYIDGVERASGVNDNSSFNWQDRVNLGWCPFAARDYFVGMVEEVQIYNKALSAAEVRQVMRGDPMLAWNPEPARGATVDIRNAATVCWSAGEGASSHDVYLGANRDAVAVAGREAPQYRGNQSGTCFPLDGLVEFGGGDYYWRIDEVAADGTVVGGKMWSFTVAGYLIVDDFERYTNDSPHRVFQTWVDGLGFSADEHFADGAAGNGSGATVGHDIWSPESPHFEGSIVETGDVHGGGKAMPMYYDNTLAPHYSEAVRTFTPAEDWTVADVTTLMLWFRGAADNMGRLYVKIDGQEVPYDGAAIDIASRDWLPWSIDLASFGVNLETVTTMAIGVEGGEAGIVYVDDIRLTKP